MSLKIEEYTRKPFTVEAVQVTVDNIVEVAEWCGGEHIVEKRDGRLIQFVKVDVPHAVRERQTRAFIGDWVLKTSTGFKCYSKRAFPNVFEKQEAQLKLFNTAL